MRILFITLFFPPEFNAGTETYTLGIAKAFLSKGHEVHVICAEDWERGDQYWNGVSEDIFDNLNVHRIHLNWLKSKNPNKILYHSTLVENWLDGFLAENKFDVVHVTSAVSLGIGVLRSVHRAGIPLLLTLTDFWFICPNNQLIRNDNSLCDGKTTPWQCQSCLMGKSHLYQRITKIPLPDSLNSKIWGSISLIPILTKGRGFRGMLLNMKERKKMLIDSLAIPDLVLSPSNFLQKIFLGNTSLSIKVIPHGHELSWKSALRKSYTDKVRFAYIGQVQETKGVDILIKAFIKTNVNERASLYIWGDVTRNIPYVTLLRNLIGQNQSIVLRGRYERDQLAMVLSNIDVLVIPSIWYENAPLVIQEAFAAKIPVITTNLGGMAEAVTDEVNGLLFERGNPDDLAIKLRRFIEDPSLIDRLQQGIPHVKTVDEEVNDLEAIYMNLIGNKRV